MTGSGTNGWNAPPLAPWLEEVTDTSSQEFFGKEACYLGLGGSIPFMAMLGERFPQAQFLITGVLGPHANAHGPNEFLHTPYAQETQLLSGADRRSALSPGDRGVSADVSGTAPRVWSITLA